MTQKLQVVARFKSNDQSNPRFTKTSSLEELFIALMNQLPVDMVYYVMPHPDGAGYSLREAGTVILDLFIRELMVQPQEGTQQPSTPLVSSSFQEQEPEQPIESSTQTNDVKDSIAFDFNFAPPKSQSELLAERGIEEKKVSLAPRKKKNKSQDLEDNLPNPVSNGKVKINKILTATRAEAANASKFGQI